MLAQEAHAGGAPLSVPSCGTQGEDARGVAFLHQAAVRETANMLVEEDKGTLGTTRCKLGIGLFEKRRFLGDGGCRGTRSGQDRRRWDERRGCGGSWVDR
jgi:hypothetical protein